jgi:hypothetical protein
MKNPALDIRISNISGLCVLASLTTGLLLYGYGIGSSSCTLSVNFFPEYIETFNVVSSLSQNQAYRWALIIFVAAFSFGLCVLYCAASATWLNRSPLALALTASSALYLCSIYPGWQGFPSTLGGGRPEVLSQQLLVVVSFVVMFALWIIRSTRWRKRLGIIVVGAATLVQTCIFINVLLSPIVFNEYDLVMIDNHYDGVFGSASQIAEGIQTTSPFLPSYGILWVSAIAAWEKAFGRLDYSFYVRATQVSQMVFWVLVILVFKSWRPHKHLALATCLALLMLFLSPQLAVAGFPNQTGIRSLGFPLGVLALMLLRDKTLKTSSPLFGLCSGVLLLINFETSVSVSLGFCVFLTLKCLAVSQTFTAENNHVKNIFEGFKNLSATFFRFACGSGIVISVFVATFRLFFNAWPEEMLTYLAIINRGSEGFMGLPFRPDPWFFVSFSCAAWMLASRVYKCLYFGFSPTAAVEAAIGVMLLTWLPYYVNRPDPGQLWTHIFLFSVLMAYYIDSRFIGLVLSSRHRYNYLVPISLMAFMVLPYSINSVVTVLRSEIANPGEAFLNRPSQISNYVEWAGIYIPTYVAERHERMSHAVSLLPNPETPKAYLSVNGFLMSRLAGPSPLARNLVGQTASRSGLAEFVEDAKASKTPFILIEAQTKPPETTAKLERLWHSMAARFKNAIMDEYAFDSQVDNWELWRRIRP